MSLGFEQAGFDVVLAVEYDRTHAAAHRFNFPRCHVLEADAARLRRDELIDGVRTGLRLHGRQAQRVPEIDVVFGGPPCQGFSVGGRMDATDPRNQLVERFVQFVKDLRPRAFVLENVPAMASRVLPSCDEPVPEWLARHLTAAGYVVQRPRVLNASGFGVPQDRRRLLVIGALQGEALPTMPAPTTAAQTKRPTMRPRPGDVGHPRTGPGLPAGPTVSDALRDIPNLDEFDILLSSDTVRLSDRDLVLARGLRSPYAARLAGDVRCPADLSAPRSYESALLTSSLRTVHSVDTVQRFAATTPGQSEVRSRFYRLHPDGLSGTLRAGSTPDRGSFSAPRPIHPTYPRVISVREAARLHGFPDWFRLSCAKWHGFRQVGNAVPPPMAFAVANAVSEALRLSRLRIDTPLVLGDLAQLRVPSGGGRRRPSATPRRQKTPLLQS